ncbi:MAG: hypothetical protein HOY71_39630, partial [Nonomuraea sp.]|nr:hypothetical protein [Nonomuraea sp.]
MCLRCRLSRKHAGYRGEHLCTSCRRPMVYAGHDFAAPRRHDARAWAAVAAVLEAGL